MTNADDELTAQQRAILLDLARLMSERRSVGEVFAAFSHQLLQVAEFDYASLVVVVDDPRYARIVGTYPVVIAPAVPGALFTERSFGISALPDGPEGTQYRPAHVEKRSGDRLAQSGFERVWSARLLSGSRTIGAITVARQDPRRFNPRVVAFLAEAGQLLGAALAQDIELANTRREAARAALLNELALVLNQGEPIGGVFGRVHALLEAAIDFDYVSFLMRVGDTRRMVMVGCAPELSRRPGESYSFEELDVPQDRSSWQKVLEYRTDRFESGDTTQFHAAGIIRMATIFIETSGEILGMFTIGRRHNRALTPSDTAFLETVGGMLGQAIANERRLEWARRDAARGALLNSLALLVNAGERVERLFDQILALLEQAVRFDYVNLMVRSGDAETMEVVGAEPVLGRPVGEVISFSELGIVERRAGDPPVQQFRTSRLETSGARMLAASGLDRVASVVIEDDRAPVAMFSLGRFENEPFDPSDCALLETISAMLGQAIANQRRLERTQREAARAGLLNEIALLLSRGEPFARVFGRAIEVLGPVIPFDHAAMYVADGTEPERFDLIGISPAGAQAAPSFTAGDLGFDTSRPIRSIVRRFAPQAVEKLRVNAIEQGLTTGMLCLLHDGADFHGFFALARRDRAGFAAEEAKFLEVLTTLFAQSLAQNRRLGRAEAEAARRRLLNELSILLNDGEPVSGMFSRMPALLAEAIEFDQVGLAVRADLSERFKMFNWDRWHGASAGDRWIDRAGANLDAIERVHYRAFQVEPRADGPGLEREFVAGGLRRLAVALLRHSSESVGVLTVARASSRPFARDEMEFLALVGQLLAQAVAHQLRLARSMAEAEDQRIVAEAAALAAREPNPREITRRLTELLGAMVPGAWAGYVMVEDGLPVLTDYTHGDSEREHRPGFAALVERAMGAGQSAGSTSDERVPPAFRAPMEMAGTGAWSATAALVGGQVAGLLVVLSSVDGFRFGERELRLLREVAQAMGPAVAKAIADERARQEACEQRILADVASIAARESTPGALAAALRPALGDFIPESSIQFAFIDGSLPFTCETDGPTWQVPIGPYVQAVIEKGQVAIGGVPDDASPAVRKMLAAGGAQHHVLTAARSAGVTIGLLVAGTSDPGHLFTDRDCALLERIASIVGPAMANGLAAERSAAEAAEQRIVAAVAAAAAREPNPRTLGAAVLRPLLELVPRPFLAYGYIEGDELVFPIRGGRFERYPRGELARLVDVEGQHVFRDIPEELARLRDFGVESVAGTAARAGGSTVGILVTGSRKPGYVFGERELRIFRLVAQIIGAGMESARAAERALQEAGEQRLLAEIAAVAARESDDQALILGIIDPLRRVIPKPAIAFAYIDGDDGVHVAPVRGRRVPLEKTERAARETGQATIQTMNGPIPEGHPGRSDIRRVIITATYSAGQPTGLLYIGTRDPDHPLGEREERLFRLIAQIVGPAMENARRAAESARLAALYQLMFASLSEAVILLDHELRAVFVNEPGERVVRIVDPGRSLRTVDEHVERMGSEIGEAYRRAAEMREAGRGRGELAGPNGPAWYDFEMLPLDDPNYRMLIVASEVTEDVRRERQEEEQRTQMQQASRLAALGELIGGVAHELNNPLTAILGFAQVLAQSSGNDAIAEEVGIIEKEALRARNIVRDLLLIARPGKIEPSLVDLREVVAHVERLRRNSWVQERIDVTMEFAEACCQAWGNENQLTQVLLNLVTNAEHATLGQERRAIAIRAQTLDGRVVIEVSDNGAGMDDATAARIFEPFFTTKHGQGTGLGLSMSYSIVRAHNGSIELQSAPGAGTTFRVVLPAAPAAAPEPLAEPAEAATTRVRVLVVDDEPSLRKVCQRLVTSMGHDCSVAQNAMEAFERAAADMPDLILCDYRLATETADEVVTRIAEHAPGLLDRIVIATGATTDAGVVELTERYGLRLIAKPYGLEDIARLIKAATPPSSLAS
ncbi:MAG: response regulator [Dehalococcoidia bacterium]|nr:response regulator [Dehalococcoidia bacterium]